MSAVRAEPSVVVHPVDTRGSPRVTGVTYVAIGERTYPEIGWNDFPVVILGWWCEALARLSSKRDARVELRFMDGPFRLAVERCDSGGDEVRISDERGMTLGVATLDALVRATAGAARALLVFCEAKGIGDADVAELRRRCRELS